MTTYSSYSDQELIGSLNRGDSAAFAELYDRHWGTLYVHALKMLHNEDEAKDIVQETFISLWSKAEGLELKSNLSFYLFSSVRHKVLNLIRDKKVRVGYTDLFSLYIDQFAGNVLEQIDEQELLLAIDEAIQRLPEKMRVVFELSRKGHLSHKEIAEQLNISESTVSRQVSNALKIIRSKLNRPESLILAMLLFDVN
jgi:RNA polymerase sigma-70 factor (family 1)